MMDIVIICSTVVFTFLAGLMIGFGMGFAAAMEGQDEKHD
jgi:hypothetical protein